MMDLRRRCLNLKFICFSLFICLIAAQCQVVPPPTPTPQPSPPPTPLLIPPIQRGDGSDLLDHLLDSGVIRVGIRVWPEAVFSPPAFRGFSNAETGGALNGFEVDLARQVAEGLGLELELVEAYPPILSTGGWQGQWDIAIASLVPFDQPEDAAGPPLTFSRPYAYMPMGILSLATANDIQGWDSLAGRQVGVLEDSAYQYLLAPGGAALTSQHQPLLPQTPPGIQPVALANLQKAIRQLGQAEFKLDALFGPGPVFQEAVKSELPVKWVKAGVQPLAIAAVPRDNLKVDRLILEINKIVDRLHRQGTLSEIYLHWYGQDFSQAEDSR
ncbi:MAG: transporter substrate-binding domain-containing protein [Anaerolineales bacterium]|nr:transporter substrate-binding domain-containing protein [Anaerolineales bacterium]